VPEVTSERKKYFTEGGFLQFLQSLKKTEKVTKVTPIKKGQKQGKSSDKLES
jgi:hypothetical protein